MEKRGRQLDVHSVFRRRREIPRRHAAQFEELRLVCVALLPPVSGGHV